MAIITSYEVLSKRKDKWEVESVTQDKDEAIDRANETLGSGHYQAVKVIGEAFDEDSGEVESFTVLSKEDRRKARDAVPAGQERRIKSDRRKAPERRRKKERRKKKKSGDWVGFLVKLLLFIWAILASAAFFICYLTK